MIQFPLGRGVQNLPGQYQENRVSLSEYLASPDKERETHYCDELTMYEIEAKCSMAGWEVIREGLLSAVTESQEITSSQKCLLCDGSVLIHNVDSVDLNHIMVIVILIQFIQGLVSYMMDITWMFG